MAGMVHQSESVWEQQLVLKEQNHSDKEGVDADMNWMNSKSIGGTAKEAIFILYQVWKST